MSFLRWVSEKLSVESLRDLELFGEQSSSQRKANEESTESLASLPHREAMGSFLPDNSSYELLTIIGKYTFLSSPRYSILLMFLSTITCQKKKRERWSICPDVITGSAKDLISTHFTDGMNELAIAYILQGILKALDYIHHMGYVHRSVKASHVLISADGQVFLSGLRSIFSLIRHGQRARVVHDFPQYSVKVLPWLSPEVLQQNLQGYDARSDIYSLGITACELANGHVPFKDMPATQMLLEKLNGTVPCLLDTSTIPPEELTMKPSRSGADSGICEGTGACSTRHANGEPSQHPYNRTFSSHFHAFVELCLQRNPERRPSASTLLSHSFFKQIKRRASDALPELLRPVAPITNFECAQPPDSPTVMASLESSLSHLEVDDWDF
nr:PREDICTED: STE20-related kinase adapter protein alpha [Lepisosteus oculatus]